MQRRRRMRVEEKEGSQIGDKRSRQTIIDDRVPF
jgi:hypothetical protein